MNVRRLAWLVVPVGVVAGLGLAPRASADPAAMATAVATPPPPGSRLSAGPLKGVTALSPVAKLKLATVAGVAPSEADLDTPMKLDMRAPYLGPHAYLEVDGNVRVMPAEDPPQVLLTPHDGALSVHFRAEATRSYLVDCVAAINGKYDVQKKVTRGEKVLSDTTATMSASDGHVTAFVPKDGTVRKVMIRMQQPVFIGQISTCEITPMK